MELRCCRSATRATGIHSSRQIIRCLAVQALVHRLSVHTDTRKHVDSTAIGGWVGVYHLYQTRLLFLECQYYGVVIALLLGQWHGNMVNESTRPGLLPVTAEMQHAGE